MKPEIFDLKQIKDVLKNLDPIHAVEQGFIAYSNGKAVIPPVGELLFKDPPGDHSKNSSAGNEGENAEKKQRDAERKYQSSGRVDPETQR